MTLATSAQLAAFLDTTLAAIRARVLVGSWAYQHVGGGLDGTPGYSYSVGRWAALQQPEFLVVGMPFDIASAILTSLAALEPAAVIGGQVEAGVAASVALRLRMVALPVSPSPFSPAFLHAYYERHPVAGAVPMLQVVWPDRFGVFPDGDGAGPSLSAQQLLPLAAGVM